jgi:hypothetical protein
VVRADDRVLPRRPVVPMPPKTPEIKRRVNMTVKWGLPGFLGVK